MKRITALLPLVLALACTDAGSQLAQAKPAHHSGVAMLPARTLHCTLGRALNLDPSKDQSVGDIRHEGAYRFALFLPAAPVRQGPPPDPGDAPEPVDPAVRVVEDPQGLASDMRMPLYRVADLWPQRVELVGLVNPPVARLIIISEIDTAKGTANLFMTRAADAASLDLDNVYQGGCRIESGPTQS